MMANWVDSCLLKFPWRLTPYPGRIERIVTNKGQFSRRPQIRGSFRVRACPPGYQGSVLPLGGSPDLCLQPVIVSRWFKVDSRWARVDLCGLHSGDWGSAFLWMRCGSHKGVCPGWQPRVPTALAGGSSSRCSRNRVAARRQDRRARSGPGYSSSAGHTNDRLRTRLFLEACSQVVRVTLPVYGPM